MRGVPARLRRAFHGLRTEGTGTFRETSAVALGVFIGCLPLYGFHLLMCWSVGFALGLNRLKMYLAANISNPLVAPWLLFAEMQTGAWLRRGSFHPLTLQGMKTTGTGEVGIDVLIGRLDARLARRDRDLRGGASLGRRSRFRRFGGPRRRSVHRREHYRLGVRARQAPRRSGLSRGVVRGRAHVRPHAARRGMRTGPDAGASGGSAPGLR